MRPDVVSECQNSDRFGRFEIDDVIGKSLHRDSAYRQVGGSAGHGVSQPPLTADVRFEGLPAFERVIPACWIRLRYLWSMCAGMGKLSLSGLIKLITRVLKIS
jgi:hypothetical protein